MHMPFPFGLGRSAWYQSWRNVDEMNEAYFAAENKLLLTKGPIWTVVTGPSGAAIASAWRIGWTFLSPRSMRTERGKVMDCLSDSPESITREVHKSVRRWRLGRILRRLPFARPAHTAFELPHADLLPPRGYDKSLWVPPDWNDVPWVIGKMLHGRNPVSKFVSNWDYTCRPYATSTITGGQWPQAKLASTKRWTTDDKCQLCHEAAGTIGHRRFCKATMPLGGWQAAPEAASLFCGQLTPDALRTLRNTGIAIVRAVIPPPRPDEEVVWLKCVGDEVDESSLSWYIDGSLLDGPRELLGRTGAGFAAVSPLGKLEAYGYALPPSWISTIPGVEAWAYSIILRSTVSRHRVITDCLGNVNILRKGAAWATDQKRPLARIWAPIFTALDANEVVVTGNQGLYSACVIPDDSLVWMPAHTPLSAIGHRTRSDGAVITYVDRRANALVDGLAKFGADLQRVPSYILKMFTSAEAGSNDAVGIIGVTCKAFQQPLLNGH